MTLFISLNDYSKLNLIYFNFHYLKGYFLKRTQILQKII